MAFAIAGSTRMIGATAAAGGVAPRPGTASPRVRGVTTVSATKRGGIRDADASSTIVFRSSSAMGGTVHRVARARGGRLSLRAASGAGEGDVVAIDESNPPAAAASAATTAVEDVSDGGDGDVDVKAMWTYFGATAGQTALMIWFTMVLDVALQRSSLPLAYQKAAVGAWFLFNALKSRTFSPLNASRPKLANERNAVAERKRPSWMPPPLAFPIIWSTIALLRAASSVVVFTAVGTLNNPAVFAMLLHLAVGDTWNSINNVERRLGTAVLGVCAVLVSVYNVVFQYYAASTTAGYLIAPSAAWISIATFLVYTIWRINPRSDGELEPLLPRK